MTRNPSAPGWLILLALVALWVHVLRQLHPEWSAYPQYSYGWFVPFLAGYLFYRRWSDRPAPSTTSVGAALKLGLLLLAAMFLLTRLVQPPNRDWRLVGWLLALEAVAGTLMLLWTAGGWRWVKHFAFPVLFAFTAVPWPHLQEDKITSELMSLVATLDVEILNALGTPALQSGNLIEIGAGVVGVDEACSGIRSLQSTLMASLLFGELYRLQWSWRAVLVAGGLTLAFILNLGRTFFLASVASTQGLAAIDKFHDQAGLSVLVVCVFALWLLAARLPKPAATEQTTGVDSTLALPRWLPVCILAWLVAVEIATYAWYELRPVQLIPNARWDVAWPTNRVAFERLEFPEKMRDLLAADHGEAALWYEPDGSRWTMYFLRWNPGPLSTRILARAHRPDFCLPSSGYRMVADHGVRTLAVGELQMPFRGFTFRLEDRVLQVFFCLWEDQRPLETQFMLSGYTPASGRIKAILEGRQDSLGHQTLEFVTGGYPDFQTAEETLRKLLPTVVQPAP